MITATIVVTIAHAFLVVSSFISSILLNVVLIFNVLSHILHYDSILAIDYNYFAHVVCYIRFPVPFVYFELGDFWQGALLLENVIVHCDKLTSLDVIHANFILLYYEDVEQVVVDHRLVARVRGEVVL